MDRFKRLEDYGVIGNLETCALIGRDGSIDWLCLPHIDAPSLFAAILDPEKGGRFYIHPQGSYEPRQSYAGQTNVLVTTWTTPSGIAELTDFMPLSRAAETGTGDSSIIAGGGNSSIIVRKLRCTGGKLPMVLHFEPRFDYGRLAADMRLSGGKALATSPSDHLSLEAPIRLEVDGSSVRARFMAEEGQTYWFVLRYGKDNGRELDGEELLDETLHYWSDWLHSSKIYRPLVQGPWHDLVIRSALVLKLLTNAATGAVIAAPTTSIPESLGGVRNWDYRYSWIRDSAFTIQAFEHLGYFRESVEYFEWLKTLCQFDESAGGPPNIKVVYRFNGGEVPRERVLGHLSGFRDSAPVRVGNAAFGQVQMDVFGEIINTFYLARNYGKGVIPAYWRLIRSLADHVSRAWSTKDSGIWELRTKPRHLTHSKLMCWVALDRSVRMAKEFELECNLKRWEEARDEIRGAILASGFSRRLNSFVQAFDYEVLDSTSLLIPIMGLLPPDDPRVRGTIEAIRKGLSDDGLLRRYEGDDGLPGKEGAFILCSFWLVRALALAGDVEAAEEEFLRILRYCSPLGLLSEEIDPRSGLLIGNFPQAFSHIGLINSALYLGKAQGREIAPPELIGSGEER